MPFAAFAMSCFPSHIYCTCWMIFGCVGLPIPPLCRQRLEVIPVAVFKYLGVPIAEEKTEGPTNVLTFLGIELDSVQMIARLPDDKLADLRSTLGSLRTRRSLKRKEIEQLLGKLNFASRVIIPGRTFMRRLYDALMHTTKLYHHVRLSYGCQLDLLWWSHLLEGWNGKALLLQSHVTAADDISIETDASDSIGYGALYGPEW
eukprot:scpid71226/ scgid9614/ 